MPDNIDPLEPNPDNIQQPQNPYIPEIPMPPAAPENPQYQSQYPDPYSQKPKKRKYVKWLIIALVSSLLLCGLGIGGCTYFVYSKSKPALDATNNFYKAAKDGDDLSSLLCEKGTGYSSVSEFESDIIDQIGIYGNVVSYNFNSVKSDSVDGFTKVSGKVVRDNGDGNKTYNAVTSVHKENGKFKVCGISELP
ncbi:MAG: hypothetical protein KBF89_05995 [Acidimicrobiia bacterium]|nr:hypothetical protein [Acidimicrobiia bacterium]